ncbi:CST complex subunit CTC1 isoform X2 [Rhineura floridana]|uniref:CST complex subunit CTC1 isoform X2 n=1 Tax=Rhineura floridana TaxID=261503 RepID=UPI002AC84209|nr:CST complex subunit CTC1 isoform X2 [Rhineura floridana]
MELPSGAVAADRGLTGTLVLTLEHQWLQALRGFGLSGNDKEIVDVVWQCLRRACSSRRQQDLLHGYSLISISDLQSQQRVPCCSHLTWSSDEFREWVRQGEDVLPNQRRLQRTHLILMGYLTDKRLGEKEELVDGSLYVRDKSGALPCVLLHFKLEWLGCLLLFPSWIYIPQAGKSTAGYVEILQDPIQVMPVPEKTIDIIPVFYPGSATQMLNARPQWKKMGKLNVAGEVCRLSTILHIHHKTFFFLFLKCFNSTVCVPVLVQKSHQLVWHHALQLGQRYVVTALKMACLKESGLRVFNTSSSSRLLLYCMKQVKEQLLDCTLEGNPAVSASTKACVELKSLLELEEKIMVPVRKSTVISYRLQDVHLVQKPLATSPPVLAACLHSTVVLKRFSTGSTLYHPVASFGNLYVQLLLRFNLSLPFYLWLVSLLETFEQRFCGFIPHQQFLRCFSQQALGAAEKFFVPILNTLVPLSKQERNIHQEILAEKHHCPLEQYQILEPPCQIPHFSQLYTLADKRCWENFNPLQQLNSVSEIYSTSAQELNCRLAWSYCSLSANSFQPRVVLLGFLEWSSNGSLQLQDRSKTLPCMIFHRDGRPFADTSLIGCLLQVEIFQLVMEQFFQSGFPSGQQLPSHEYVKERKSRPCVQFCFEDATVLHIPEKRPSRGPTVNERIFSGEKDDGSATAELRSPEEKVSNVVQAEASASTAEGSKGSAGEAGWVSRLFLVTQKEGLVWRNYLLTSEDKGKDGQTKQICFQATVVWMGKPEPCTSLGASGRQQELKSSALQETSEAQQKLLLLFLRKSLRWFPFLHTDHLYKLIIPQCKDLDVFDKLCSSSAPGNLLNVLSHSLFLPVPDAALLHHVGCMSQLIPALSELEQKLFSIEEILSSSFTGSLVSFSGEIVERTLRESLFGKKPLADFLTGNLLPWDYTVKLSVSPIAGSSVVLDVYVEPPFLPYLWGLLPGARILFQNVQRKVSRFGNVYCTYNASSCVCVLTAATHRSSQHLAAKCTPTVYLSNILLQPSSLCRAQVVCHLMCVLSLSLRWICSLCNNIFTEGRWSQCNPPCSPHAGVCKASAKILVEDGTGECVVVCTNQQVRKMLGLSLKEWDVVQNHVQCTGSIDIQHKEASTGVGRMEEHEEVFTWYLRSLCRSPAVCRSILLTLKLDRKPPEVQKAGSRQLRRFYLNELEFLSWMRNRRNFLCLNVQET